MSNRGLARFRAAARNVRTSTTVALWVCLVATIALFVTAFLMPPQGEISPSVLKAGGFIFAYATLMVAREAIMEGFGIKLTHGDTTVIVHDLDGGGSPHNQEESNNDEDNGKE